MKRHLLNLKIALIALCTVGAVHVKGQGPVFEWAQRIGGSGEEQGLSMAVDAMGNIYCAGTMSNTVDFDPGSGAVERTSNGETDAFVAKYSASGALLWAKTIGGAAEDNALDIAVDVSGNVYVSGSFGATVDFNPGGVAQSVTSGGFIDAYVLKMDTDGNFVWVVNAGGVDAGVIPNSIAIDAIGNIYTTGMFLGAVDFDPGAGDATLGSTGAGFDVFVWKLNSLGAHTWAVRVGGNSEDIATAIATDINSNVYISGLFRGTADLDPGAVFEPFVSAGNTDVFVLKLDVAGNYIWAAKMGGTRADAASAIAVDLSGNIYTTGTFNGTADFDPGAAEVSLATGSNTNTDIFISKLDANGAFVSAQKIGGSGLDISHSLLLGEWGSIYLTGKFSGTVDFDPGAGTSELTSKGIIDAFITKLDASGSFEWVRSMGGAGEDHGVASALDLSGNLYTTGHFTGTAEFNTDGGTAELTSAGLSDVFLHKMSQDYLLPIKMGELSGFVAANKAHLQWKAFDEHNNTGFEVERSANGIDYQSVGFVASASSLEYLKNESNHYSFTDQEVLQQPTYYRLRQADANGTVSYSNTVRLSGDNRTVITAYPNPANDAFVIKSSRVLENAAVRLVDVTGSVLIQKQIAGSDIVSFDMMPYPAGVYFAEVIGDGAVARLKMIKK